MNNLKNYLIGRNNLKTKDVLNDFGVPCNRHMAIHLGKLMRENGFHYKTVRSGTMIYRAWVYDLDYRPRVRKRKSVSKLDQILELLREINAKLY